MKPLPRHQCPRHPGAWVALSECGGSEEPRVCQHCRDEGLSEVEARMELLTAEPEPEPDYELAFVRSDGDHLAPAFNWRREDLEELAKLIEEVLR